MIRGSGVDMEKIQRVREVYEKHEEHFLCKILTENEAACFFSFASERRRMEYLAGRFSAKEAVAKSLGCGIGAALGWQEVEIARHDQGKPLVILHPAAEERLGLTGIDYQLHLSLSHAEEWVIAQAILEVFT